MDRKLISVLNSVNVDYEFGRFSAIAYLRVICSIVYAEDFATGISFEHYLHNFAGSFVKLAKEINECEDFMEEINTILGFPI